MARTRSGRSGGRAGRGGRDDPPNPQVQEFDPVVQEEAQDVQEEVPVVQGANVAQVPNPVVVVAPVLPNEARNQVPAKFKLFNLKLHPYIYNVRFAYRILEKSNVKLWLFQTQNKTSICFICINRKVSCFLERSCLIFKVCFAISVRKDMVKIFCHVYDEGKCYIPPCLWRGK